MSDINNSRRGFLKKMAIGAAALPILGKVALHEVPAYAQTVTTALDEKDPMAVSLGYHQDATKVDKAKWTKKAAADGDKQLCKNCVLYLEGGKKIPGKDGEWGKCGLFPNGLVAGNGWCNSFAPKVGA